MHNKFVGGIHGEKNHAKSRRLTLSTSAFGVLPYHRGEDEPGAFIAKQIKSRWLSVSL